MGGGPVYVLCGQSGEHDNKAFEGVEHPVTKQYCAEMFL